MTVCVKAAAAFYQADLVFPFLPPRSTMMLWSPPPHPTSPCPQCLECHLDLDPWGVLIAEWPASTRKKKAIAHKSILIKEVLQQWRFEVECELLDYNQKVLFVCFLKDSSESEGFGLKIPVVRSLHWYLFKFRCKVIICSTLHSLCVQHWKHHNYFFSMIWKADDNHKCDLSNFLRYEAFRLCDMLTESYPGNLKF